MDTASKTDRKISFASKYKFAGEFERPKGGIKVTPTAGATRQQANPLPPQAG